VGQAQGLLTPVSQQLNQTASAIASATGTATFTFQSPPTGFTWTGTLQVTNAPATALFTATIGATTWEQWAGDSTAGPVQAHPNQQLVVAATGLSPGITYALPWTGSSDAEGSVQPIYPDINTSAQTVQFSAGTLVLQQTVTVSGGIINFAAIPVPSAARTLIFIIGQLSLASVTITGNQSGLVYYNQPVYLKSATTDQFVVVPIVAGLDSTFTFAGSGLSNVSTAFTIYADTAQYDESVFYNGVAQTSSAASSTSTLATVLTGPARLLNATLALTNTVAGDAVAVLRVNSASNAIRLELEAIGGLASAIAFPPNTILPAGATVQTALTVGTGLSAGGVTYAYP
jgi:hypothetical protein